MSPTSIAVTVEGIQLEETNRYIGDEPTAGRRGDDPG